MNFSLDILLKKWELHLLFLPILCSNWIPLLDISFNQTKSLIQICFKNINVALNWIPWILKTLVSDCVLNHLHVLSNVCELFFKILNYDIISQKSINHYFERYLTSSQIGSTQREAPGSFLSLQNFRRLSSWYLWTRCGATSNNNPSFRTYLRNCLPSSPFSSQNLSILNQRNPFTSQNYFKLSFKHRNKHIEL